MSKGFEILDVDWITAQMYGKNLPKRQNNVPLSKNGIESYDELDEEINEILDLLDHTLFAPRKEKFWKDNSLR